MYCQDLTLVGVGAFSDEAASERDDYESEALEFDLDDHTTGVDHEHGDDHDDEEELDVEHHEKDEIGNDSDSECDRLVIDTGEDSQKHSLKVELNF